VTSTVKNKAGFPIRSYCRSCREDFSSDSNFDRHRRGKHAYRWSPEHEDGRRCLDTEELQRLGWKLNGYGRWYDASRAHPRALEAAAAKR
jgi:hypothetical protein